MAAGNPPSNGSSAHNLPGLIETFPGDSYPLREIGTGFTAQSVRGVPAESCAATAAEMLIESRTLAMSSVSSEGSSASAPFEGEHFPVPDLPLPPDAAKVCAAVFSLRVLGRCVCLFVCVF